MNTLPDIPSDLIELSLADLAQVEAQPETFTVDMGVWAWVEPDEKCAVCLAGAVLINTLGFQPSHGLGSLMEWELPEKIENKLYALDYFRTGKIYSGLFVMGVTPTSIFKRNRVITSYRLSPEQFRVDMNRLVSDLREAGL